MRTASEMVLWVSQIRKTFDDEIVLDGIDLTVNMGEFVVLVGPNACGKTTLLRIIMGVLPSDDGNVDVCGHHGPNRSGSLGVVFQKPLLLPWLTVEENACLPLRISNHPTNEGESSKHLLELLELESKREAYPKGLSGGEAQKVAIARALVMNPAMLLMDEPFSALDDVMRHTLQDKLLSIWRETSKTVLFVTHDLDEAVFLADRVVVLSRKPSQVKEEVAIRLTRPRQPESPDFEELVLSVRRALLS